MFVRVRRATALGQEVVHFAVLRSVRTPQGPRQVALAGWSSAISPASRHFRPSLSSAVSALEVELAAALRAGEHGRELLRASNGAVVARGWRGRRITRQKVERNVTAAQSKAADLEARLAGLREAHDVLGDWTWTGPSP